MSSPSIGTITTNFSLRVAQAKSTQLVGDSSIGSKINSAYFYTKTFTVNKVGWFIGSISSFLAIQTPSPVNVTYTQADNPGITTTIYCSALLILHGALDNVTICSLKAPVILTVWFDSDLTNITFGQYIDAFPFNPLSSPKAKQLALTNMQNNTGSLSLPILHKGSFVGIPQNDLGGIPTTTHRNVPKVLSVNTTKS